MTRKIKRYGWIPDLPDRRDHLYAATTAALQAPPPATDLRAQCPPVYDQGQLGSCTANAIAGALEFDQVKQGSAHIFAPSRLFIYYNERVIEGTVGSDCGAMIRDGIATVAAQGACPEDLWPYVIDKFADQPSDDCYSVGAQHEAIQYQAVAKDLDQMKGCLADGTPFVFGFTVYQSFETDEVAQTGVVPLPDPRERVLGGHAVLAVGYDDANTRFLARNSWGPGWGMAGYFTIPYSYLLQPGLAADFWVIQQVH